MEITFHCPDCRGHAYKGEPKDVYKRMAAHLLSEHGRQSSRGTWWTCYCRLMFISMAPWEVNKLAEHLEEFALHDPENQRAHAALAAMARM